MVDTMIIYMARYLAHVVLSAWLVGQASSHFSKKDFKNLKEGKRERKKERDKERKVERKKERKRERKKEREKERKK
jgi:hypothetical protein